MHGLTIVKRKLAMKLILQIFLPIQPLRSLKEIRNEILELEEETVGMIKEVIQ